MANLQGTDIWRMERLGHCTGSRMDDVLAKRKDGTEAAGRRNYRIQLAIERLTGKPSPEGFVSQAMLDGIENEQFARMAYEVHAGDFVEPVGFLKHPTIAWFGASPDSLIGEDGVLEIKCPLPATHWDYIEGNKPPADYLPQMLCELSVTGRKWVDFVSFCPLMPERLRLFVVRLERDEAEVARIEGEAKKFLAEVEEMTERLRRRAA